MKRAHPLAILIFLALFLLSAWINNFFTPMNHIFSLLSAEQLVAPVPYNSYWTEPIFGIAELHVFHFLISLLICFVLAFLPAYLLHGLLRRRLQMHLSTTIILMLTAATLLALNFHPQRASRTAPFGDNPEYIEQSYGWPKASYKDPSDFRRLNYSVDSDIWFTPVWYTPMILGNTLVALAILSLIALISEYLLRRRRIPKGGKQ